MKKGKTIIIVCVLFCLISASIIYTRPMTIEQRYPFLDITKCTEIHGYFRDGTIETETKYVIRPDDSHFDEMIELFQSAAYKTKIQNILPRGTKYHTYREGDFKWNVTFRFEDVLFPNGNVGSGDMLHVNNYFGDLELYFDGAEIQCSVKEQEQWMKEVMDIITQYPD